MKRILVIALVLAGSIFLFSTWPSHQEVFEQPKMKLASPLPPPIYFDPPPAEVFANTSTVAILPPPRAILPPPPQENILPPPPPKTLPQSELYKKGLLATVNFLCPDTASTYTVATGAIVDKHGYIIANAHITKKNNLNVTCTIRRGSPAVPIGKAKLVFLPSAYHTTTDEEAQAHLDFSLWKMEGTDNDWPFWDIDFNTSATPKEELLVQSYPAELLSSEVILKNLALVFSNTIVSAVDASIIASHATITAQHGSSGGILIDPYTAKLRGMIFGISADEKQQINERILYAITPSRINSIVWQETKKQFGEYLATLPEPTY